MTAEEKVARKLAHWIRYLWEGLNEHSIVDKGYPEWIPGGGYQGGKEDLLRLAKELLSLKDD